MTRFGLFLLVAGGVVGYIGFNESRLGSGMTAEPEEITLAQLIQRGPEGNPHVKVRDFSLADSFVIEEKNGRWNMAYIPATPRTPELPPGIPVNPTGPIQAIIMTGKVHNDQEVANLAREPALTGMVVNRIKSLNKQQKELLQQNYPNTDFEKCLIFNHGRAIIAPWVSNLMLFGGGALALLGIVLMLVSWKRYGSM